MHKLIYFDQLHEKTPQSSRTNVLEKTFLSRIQVLEFFSSTRNEQILLFLGLFEILLHA